MSARTCSKCRQSKPLTEFHRNRAQKKGYHHSCRVCKSAEQRRLMTAERDGYPVWFHYHLKRQYGITVSDYQEKLTAQNGVCAICAGSCSNGHRLVVDHDHETGQVRDLLCHRCNLVVGAVEESADFLALLAAYIERHDAPSGIPVVVERKEKR